MKRVDFLFTAAAAAIALPAAANAAVTVVGDSAARLCYEAADSRSLSTGAGIARCDEALKLESLGSYETVATFVNRGILKMRSHQIDEAIADFDRAISDDPNQAEAYLNKGMALLQRDTGHVEAVPLFSAAIEKNTRRPAIAYYGRGVANELSGKIKQAYLDYKQASVLDPRWRDPKAELSRFTVRH
jgi:tetratricopeptide (TPR) repeat protein